MTRGSGALAELARTLTAHLGFAEPDAAIGRP